MTFRNTITYFVFLLTAAIFWACEQPVTVDESGDSATSLVAKTGVRVMAGEFTAYQGSVQRAADSLVSTGEGEHWLAFNVVFPEAGRYQLDLYASAKSDSASVWIEDYYGNPDGRTYNVTGRIDLDHPGEKSSAQSVFTKVGSPFNAGLHRMQLHIDGRVDIEKIDFTLLKSHQTTPNILTQQTDGEEWTIVWADEFDGNGAPDTSKWTYDVGDWGWGNNELQHYTEARSKNARLENGHLIIEAHKDDMGAVWTSARLTTRGKVAFTYGRIEFRAMVPAEKGNWAAGWTLGDNYIDELSWPYCGEIDIMESVGYQMDNETGNGTAHASVHCGAYYFKRGNQHTGTIPVENMNNAFHTYTIDWTKDGMTATVDGKPYFTYSDTSTPLSWPFDKPQNIILNLAMGGGWGGHDGMDESINSQKMTIDYVRVYEKRK